jgi:aminoglycoside phosphotransferase family enzyme/predicted kinase
MNSTPALTEVHGDPRSDGREPPEIHETHTGIVVLVGDRAYKAEKPIVTDFLDFSTAARREEACQSEVRLNSRLAADSYLGVAHLTDATGGEPEPVVVMRRYPDSIRLASMVRRGEPVEEHLAAIAITLARFHAEATRSRQIDADARVPAIRARWQENLTELRAHIGTLLPREEVEEAQRLAMQFIDNRTSLFDDRIADRRIVDGHGDLQADDTFCSADTPVLLDCLEFDDHLRHVDTLDDAAFLAMDLEFLGRSDLAVLFLDAYRRASADQAPASLAHFFIAYRAIVRTKVDCIRAGQGRAEAGADARRHLELAVAHLRAGTVRLVLVGGGPGTGKTTLARALGERFAAQVISSDAVRREMQADGEIEGIAGTFNSGLYTPDQIEAVYAAMLHRARLMLAGGLSVILDGTWRDPRQRALAQELGRQQGCPTVELVCAVPLEIAVARIADRGETVSDATPQIASAIAAEDHSWSGAHPVDTSRPLSESVAEAQRVCCLAI